MQPDDNVKAHLAIAGNDHLCGIDVPRISIEQIEEAVRFWLQLELSLAHRESEPAAMWMRQGTTETLLLILATITEQHPQVLRESIASVMDLAGRLIPPNLSIVDDTTDTGAYPGGEPA